MAYFILLCNIIYYYILYAHIMICYYLYIITYNTLLLLIYLIIVMGVPGIFLIKQQMKMIIKWQ